MKWYEITVFTTDAGLDPVCAVLMEAGLSGFTIEESREKAAEVLLDSVPYWDFADMEKIGTDHPCVKTYLEVKDESRELLKKAEDALEGLKKKDIGFDISPLTMSVTERDDEDWANNWKQYYKPLDIGEKLLVLPSWEEEPEGNNRTVLRLDPGMAFGSGTHHTTRMCLEFLEETVKNGDHLIDLGCGSGILSIAGLLLGAEDAVAVDIDPVAEHIAMENAEMNGITEENYRILIGDVVNDLHLKQTIAGQYDIVVANIVADVIIRLSPIAANLCKKGAPYIVSGIIDERVDEVKQAVLSAGFEIRKTNSQEGWNAILAYKA